ncbi:hypothetical protein [Bacteroides sedimenti]
MMRERTAFSNNMDTCYVSDIMPLLNYYNLHPSGSTTDRFYDLLF